MAWTERYVSVSGAGAHDGTSEANAWTLAEAIAAYAAGQRLNVKAGTYANTTTDRSFNVNGTTTSPIWIRGYNTTIGDLDADFTTTKPNFTFTTGRLTVSGNHTTVSNINVSGAQTTNGQIRVFTGTNIRIHRCRVECTAANSAGRAVSHAATMAVYTDCWFKSTSSADVADVSGTQTQFFGCVFEGGANGLTTSGAISFDAQYSVFNNQGGDAIRSSATGVLSVVQCSIYSPGSDGIEMTSLPTLGVIIGNIFSECGGYAINNSTGSNTNTLVREHNLFHSNTSGNTNGLGDSVTLADQTDSASPFTNAASNDFSIISTSNAKGNSCPGRYENQTYTSGNDIGAVQRIETAADYPAVGNVRSGISYGSGTYTGTLTVPAVGNVLSTVSYGAGGTEYTGTYVVVATTNVRSGTTFGAASAQTGTLALPSVGNVVSGVGYGAGGTEYTGTYACDYPLQSSVVFGVTYASGALTGNVTIPAVGNVRSGVGFGSGGGAQFTGTMVEPAVGDVQSGVTYGASSGLTGTFASPAAGSVVAGVGYGAGGTEFTGTYVVVAASNVRSGTAYGAASAQTGTLSLPSVGNVASGIQYGAGGTEYTGTLGGGTITITVE